MRFTRYVLFILTAVTVGLMLQNINRPVSSAQRFFVTPGMDMKLSSPVFREGETIPARYTCDGENRNPPLLISNVPDGIRSLVLIVEDPDAPSGTWTHWTVWNIPPLLSTIEVDKKIPNATEGMTSFGTAGYGGPCPPSGTHRYVFTLFALNEDLVRGPDTTVEELRHAMIGHVITKAQLIGTYRRQ